MRRRAGLEHARREAQLLDPFEGDVRGEAERELEALGDPIGRRLGHERRFRRRLQGEGDDAGERDQGLDTLPEPASSS